MVLNKVKWPHENVLSGLSKEQISYAQFFSDSVAGWLLPHYERRKNSESEEILFDYLVSILHDAQDFSWEAAKASHAVLLWHTEQGEISSYSLV